MRVYNGAAVSGVGVSGAARRIVPPGSRFTLPAASQAKANTATASINVMTGLDALMALQEVEDPIARRKKAVLRGKTLLDSLDELKAAMLAGKIPGASLQRIVEQLRQRTPSADPQLDDLLAHIELRAEVELAKLGIRNS